MSSLKSLANLLLRRKPFNTRRSSAPISYLSPETLVEEGKLPYYQHEQYYPVHIGDIFKSRYQAVGKLGYGTYSTVWLCRELIEKRYGALKISTYLRKFPRKTSQEFLAYDHLSKIEADHPGRLYIRDVFDSFEIAGQHGRHQCLVQPPMHLSVLEMLHSNPNPFDLTLLKQVVQRILTALDFLHTKANIVHTDLKTDNLMLIISDGSMLQDFEKSESKHPSPRKIIDETRTIYTSRKLDIPKNGIWGYPVLCDFGEARIGKVHETGPMIQPHIYRAPEVTFEMPWGPPIDIWNVGALIWDLFEGKHLFDQLMDRDGDYDPFLHMAQMVAFLGPPPSEFISRSETTSQCFDPDGRWLAGEHAPIPETSLEEVEVRLEGEDKKLFLQFVRSMLQWLPEKRKTAKELLEDPWLSDLPAIKN